MAPRNTGENMSDDTAIGTAGLINGDFDIDSLIAELTIEEKSSLLAGTATAYASITMSFAKHAQERTSGTLKRFQD